ncbi:MAG: hypothetical protein WC782_00415 [Methylococcaceae bacterium]|jgi:hypothetical protein
MPVTNTSKNNNITHRINYQLNLENNTSIDYATLGNTIELLATSLDGPIEIDTGLLLSTLS